MSNVSQPSATTESGNHRCTRKSAACEQGVCICRPIPAQDPRPISAVEYFVLAVQYAKDRGLRSIPVPMDIATSVLEALQTPKDPNDSPPPLEVTSVSFDEEQRRTRSMRIDGTVGLSSSHLPTRLPITPSERRAMNESGRGWHQGM